MRFPSSALAAVLATALLAGCGDSDPADPETTAVQGDQQSVLATVDALQTSARDGDGAMICGTLFTASLVRSIEKASKQDCAAEVKENLFKPDQSFSVGRDIIVKGMTATATILEQNSTMSTLHLVKQGGAWRIDRVTTQSS